MPDQGFRAQSLRSLSNAARVYGIDLDALAIAAATDDLSWTRAVAAELGS